jgi:hypothetical protein
MDFGGSLVKLELIPHVKSNLLHTLGPIRMFRIALQSVALIAVSMMAVAHGDEVFIDREVKSNISVGDFFCSQCPTASSNSLSLFNGDTSNLTAGELWTFFDEEGFGAVNKLTLCLDVQPAADASNVGIRTVELKIEDPEMGGLITNVSLQGNSLKFYSYDVTAFKPEARLEIDLGYDFMKRFSADSTALISLDIAGDSDSTGVSPIISVEGAGGFFAADFNAWAMIGFASFWAIAFILLNRFTKPLADSIEVKPGIHQSTPAIYS